jgi:RNA polymerase sigma-70 factor (ECF subfamily)
MSDHSTLHLQRCLDRLQAGDTSARNDLINSACDRLQRLTRKMLNDYRGVRRWEETGDVFQNAMMRLCRALQDIAPGSLREFYRLAALQVRRELIDLARHHYGPLGAGAHHASQAGATPNASGVLPALHEGADVSSEPSRLALWTEFHRQVEALPQEQREVFDLIWYQGLSQANAGTLLGISERTIKRYWREARLKLYEALGGTLPGE